MNQLKYENIKVIVIDGFVYLDDELKPELGAHLYHALQDKIPIIGLARRISLRINELKSR